MLLSSRLLILLTLTTVRLRGDASLLTPSLLTTVSHSPWSEEEVLPPDGTCTYPFCLDGGNCAEPQCAGCPFNCVRTGNLQCPSSSETCNLWCKPGNTDGKCSGCIHSDPIVPYNSRCHLGTFRDVTGMMFSGKDSKYWNEWLKPGKPFTHFSSAVMADIDGDSVVDFFTPMHGTRYNEFGVANIQLGNTVVNKTDTARPMYLRDVSWRIAVDDPWEGEEGFKGTFIDKHGSLIADLDNDGVLDIFIMTGGGRGYQTKNPHASDNMILFGERAIDDETGKEVTIFRGGRLRAKEAGLGNRYGRGRISYLMDVNGDGLLDMFLLQERRKDNILAPGSLYVNQGDRTWRKDTSMSEFATAAILTDADGDSIAEEVLIVRAYCFPLRENPNHDDEYGPFSELTKDFCSTRPVGSIAVYKYNSQTQRMEEISPKYTNITADGSMQPDCCSLGISSSTRNDCSAISIASGDLDGDGRADHVFLYESKMEFFFASDRPVGELPIEKKYVGLTIALPEWCTAGTSIRIVDMNNFGKPNIIVMCSNLATFLVYNSGNQRDKWWLAKNCNDNGSLGDITFSSFNITLDDLIDSCEKRNKHFMIEDVCEWYEKGDVNPKHQTGLTLADINNDGYMDAVIGTRYGYQKFFLYQPSEKSRRNRHISFRLIGDGKGVNLYGIGATLVLVTKHMKNLKEQSQFKEISSYQHISEEHGHQDGKIIFGLSKQLHPVKLMTTWPNGVTQTLWLTEFDFSTQIYPAIDVNYYSGDGYFRIRNKKLSNLGDQLCLHVEEEERMVRTAVCPTEDPTEQGNHFSFNEWGMIKYRALPEFCLAEEVIGNNSSVVLKNCTDSVPMQHSWHSTQHGFLRWSGSNKVLGVNNAEVGEIPMLLSMDMTSEEQKWLLDILPSSVFTAGHSSQSGPPSK